MLLKLSNLNSNLTLGYLNAALNNSAQVVNGLIKTATQSTFWVHVRLLEDVVLVPACWEALILGCDDKALSFCLEDSCF